jgi:hypothetical protein
MMLCLIYISAKISLHILGYSFCAERHNLAHFYKINLSLKALKISAQKLLFGDTKNVDEINPLVEQFTVTHCLMRFLNMQAVPGSRELFLKETA